MTDYKSKIVTFLISDWLPLWLGRLDDRLADEVPIRGEWFARTKDVSNDDSGTHGSPEAVTAALRSTSIALRGFVEYRTPYYHKGKLAGVSQGAAWSWSGMQRMVWSANWAQRPEYTPIIEYICMWQAWQAVDCDAEALKHRECESRETMRAHLREYTSRPRQEAEEFAKRLVEGGCSDVEIQSLAGSLGEGGDDE